MPPRIFSSVLLPHRDGPSSVTKDPGAISMDRLSITVVRVPVRLTKVMPTSVAVIPAEAMLTPFNFSRCADAFLGVENDRPVGLYQEIGLEFSERKNSEFLLGFEPFLLRFGDREFGGS